MTDAQKQWSVLVVDDDPMVMKLLSTIMKRADKTWDVQTASSGQAALELLDERRFDVVISDLNMPLMSGTTLLNDVEKRFPDTLRLIHSGSVASDRTLESMTVSHQFIGKPCPPRTLADAVRRVCAIRRTLRGESLQELIGRVGALPSLPSLYMKLVEELESADPSLRKIGEIIGRDVAMTVKILQVVNSALFGLRCRINDPVQAAAVLGLQTIRTLVLALEVFAKFDGNDEHRSNMEALWRHSMATGVLARKIAKLQGHDRDQAEESFLAGVLHDLGKLVLWAGLPAEYAAVHEEAKETGEPLTVVEERMLGGSHAQVGAYLLTLWGFSPAIVDAIAWHHAPANSEVSGFQPLTAVHVANALEHAADGTDDATERVDRDYLGSIGMEPMLPAWCDLATDQDARREAG